MKRYLWFILVLILAMTVVACGGTQPAAEVEETTGEEAAPTEAVVEEEAPVGEEAPAVGGAGPFRGGNLQLWQMVFTRYRSGVHWKKPQF